MAVEPILYPLAEVIAFAVRAILYSMARQKIDCKEEIISI
jgi:hypothetical protein